jgi:pyruvate/2-oxoglutarate dehydrogenase complex dihydrolipoamide acyltransferase (E2) component
VSETAAGRTPVLIPKVSMAAEEAIFVEWLAEDGASVAAGDHIYSVETDKAEVEIEAPATGVLRHGKAVPDDTYPVGHEVGHIEGPA